MINNIEYVSYIFNIQNESPPDIIKRGFLRENERDFNDFCAVAGEDT